MEHVASRDNPADLFTKALPRDLHQDFTRRIGVMTE
jgi:hypothetical protein